MTPEQLAAKNDRLACKVAWKWLSYARRHGVDDDDLLQAARIGLFVGCQRWEPARGAFSTGVYPWITSYIRQEISKHQPGGYREGSRANDRRKGRFRAIPPTDSLNDPGCGFVEPIDLLPDTGELQDESCARSEVAAKVRAGVAGIPDERLRRVLTLRFGLDGGTEMNLAEIGVRLDLSRERVRQLERQALNLLRSRLAA